MAQKQVSICGEYENFLYGPPEKNHYHYVTVLEDEVNKCYIWRTQCNEWTLTQTGNNRFAVGKQCPYFEKGYVSMEFKMDHKGNVIGAFGMHASGRKQCIQCALQYIGPWREYFTKVERHSDIKYNLKGVERVKCGDNDTNFDEKEGNETDGNMNDFPVNKSLTSLEWKGGKCAKNKCVGRVSIDENFVTFPVLLSVLRICVYL